MVLVARNDQLLRFRAARSRQCTVQSAVGEVERLGSGQPVRVEGRRVMGVGASRFRLLSEPLNPLCRERLSTVGTSAGEAIADVSDERRRFGGEELKVQRPHAIEESFSGAEGDRGNVGAQLMDET